MSALPVPDDYVFPDEVSKVLHQLNMIEAHVMVEPPPPKLCIHQIKAMADSTKTVFLVSCNSSCPLSEKQKAVEKAALDYSEATHALVVAQDIYGKASDTREAAKIRVTQCMKILENLHK